MNDHRKIVLLVEDEPLIAMVGCDMMQDLGFEVLEARTELEALAVLGVEKGVSLLFADIDLADGSSGMDLAREFSRLCPGVPIIITSGRFRPSALPPGARFLPKPYSDHDLAAATLPDTGMSRRHRDLELALV
ncbi:response regulator [Agrobacterium albertimagni AOL15]|uniref:Response regulator n=1 Tax=Agrobacterium albertimagni AOL15 TaxID=1156935 RepID=K2PDV4_9HYPH|nr:response regulator [Agrobacterium albertimagni]EKF59108.1 response regulator [Agrobacterium albertimagni AOL15]